MGSAACSPPPISPRPAMAAARTGGCALDGDTAVALVRGPASGPTAERIARATLADRGVTRVTDVPPADAAGAGSRVVLWVGHAGGLARLGVEPDGAGDPEAYRLAVGRDADGVAQIVLDGSGPAGTCYAAHAFRQLARGPELPGVLIRDAPAMRYRGSIEGFYGTPWSHRDRLAHLDFLGAHRMNTYVYAPKRDPYHRDRWREPYPPSMLAELAELVLRAEDNHMTLVFAVSPGLSIRYSVADDIAALLAKYRALHAIGVRAFAVAFDDIDGDAWHCAADRERFACAGEAHAWLANQVQQWARSAGGVERPAQIVPTEYADLADTPYKRALRERLDPEVHVWWTGDGVVPRRITRDHAVRAARVFGHPILVWDNFPTNDYIPGRVPLGDYSGREGGLSEHVAGVLANPMNQQAMSTLALRSVAEYGWADTGFDAHESWRAGLAELAGGRPDVRDALATFADLNTRDERLHQEQAPRTAAELAAVREWWRAGETAGALAELRRIADRIVEAPRRIRAGLRDPRFAEEAGAWLEATRLWGLALAETVPMLAAVADGDAGTAERARGRVVARMAEARRQRDHRVPHRQQPVKVGDGVLDEFLGDALALCGQNR